MAKCLRGIIVILGLFVFVVFFTIINFLLDAFTNTFFIGIPFGVVLGIISCLYIANTYDFTTMRVKKTNSFWAGNRGYLGALLGATTATVLSQLFGKEMWNFLMGCSVPFTFIVLGYITFYLCK